MGYGAGVHTSVDKKTQPKVKRHFINGVSLGDR